MSRLSLVAQAGLDLFGRDRGTGTVLPTDDLTRGDVYYHTSMYCLLVWTGTVWRQAHTAEGTNAQRLAITTGLLYKGFRFRASDTDHTWEWDGSTWTHTSGPARVVRRLSTGSASVAVGTSYAALTDPGDITLTARAGEWIRVTVAFVADSLAGDLRTDVATVVNGSIVNYLSGGASNGIAGWTVIAGRYDNLAGSVLYQLAAGDIAADGTVTLRTLNKVTSGSRTILRNSADPIMFAAEIVS